MEKFVKGEKDVLVATDVASKGLDFPDIQHVINYDLPEDIENYGKREEEKNVDPIRFFFSSSNRSNRSLWSTRFSFDIYQQDMRSVCFCFQKKKFLLFFFEIDEAILLDLKHLLIEAKQVVPPFLLQLESESEPLLDIGGKMTSTSLNCERLFSLFFV